MAGEGGIVRLVFQPVLPEETKTFWTDFAPRLNTISELILCPPDKIECPPKEGEDVADLYLACRKAFAGRNGDSSLKLFLARHYQDVREHLSNVAHANERCSSVRRIWIGQGTNTWKSDLKLNVEYVKTTALAGASGASLGIPWMAGVPGTIGGWIKMNAGAFGHSISEVIERVKVDGKWLTRDECGFAYRHSDIQGEIQDFRLIPFSREGTAEDFLSRRPKFPSGTYGSFFKNPEGDYAGRLLEAVGAKEFRVGGAFVWREHANVIVRGEGATPSDVLALARLMRNRVWLKFGVKLEPEVQGIVFESDEGELL